MLTHTTSSLCILYSLTTCEEWVSLHWVIVLWRKMNNLPDNHGHLSDYAFFPNKWFCYVLLKPYAEFFMSWISAFWHLFIMSTNIFFFLVWNETLEDENRKTGCLKRYITFQNGGSMCLSYKVSRGLRVISRISNLPFKWLHVAQHIVSSANVLKTNLYLMF